jgi:hypothetical protein
MTNNLVTVGLERLGMKESTLRARLRKGWTIERALGKRVSERMPYHCWRPRRQRSPSEGNGMGIE